MYSLSNYYTALPLGSVCSEVVVDVVVEHVILHQVQLPYYDRRGLLAKCMR